MTYARRFPRRSVLKMMAAPAVLSACGAMPSPGTVGKAAMLLPLSGQSAALGEKMKRAAEIAGRRLPVFDTGSNPDGAAVAAQRAVESGATVLAGPLYATSTRAVLTAIPREVPVLSLSNDATLAQDGAFVMGVTPYQSTETILNFTAGRGVRSIVVMAPDGPLANRFAQAAQRLGPGLDLRIGTRLVGAGVGSDLAADLRAALDGRLPDAVYLPAGGASLQPLAGAVDRTGSLIVGSTQWNGTAALAAPSLEGAFYPSPDPAEFAPFSLTYRDRFQADPGIVTALAHDAAALAQTVSRSQDGPRRALLMPSGHTGALGRYRFAANGAASRDLSVMQLQGGSPFLVGPQA